MRGMSQDVTPKPIDWSVLKTLFPYLLEFRARIGLAVLCLVLAKLASVGLPFILKHIVDGLDAKDVSELITLPLGLLLAYGVVRFSNVLFGELRDTLFGRVTERGLFHTEIQTEDRDLVTLPNLYLVTNPVKVVRTFLTVLM